VQSADEGQRANPGQITVRRLLTPAGDLPDAVAEAQCAVDAKRRASGCNGFSSLSHAGVFGKRRRLERRSGDFLRVAVPSVASGTPAKIDASHRAELEKISNAITWFQSLVPSLRGGPSTFSSAVK
jgi:hypothetical protein